MAEQLQRCDEMRLLPMQAVSMYASASLPTHATQAWFMHAQNAPSKRERFAPSVFFSSLFCLKFAKARMLSATPLLPTASMNLLLSSHLLPKLLGLSVRVSLVCRRRVLWVDQCTRQVQSVCP